MRGSCTKDNFPVCSTAARRSLPLGKLEGERAMRRAAWSTSEPSPLGTTQISVPLKLHLSFKSGMVGVKSGFPAGAE